MAMRNARVIIKGVTPVLQNNPQSVDPFNVYAKRRKVLTSKRAKTDEDQLDLRTLDVESKAYFDKDIGVYVPSKWLLEAISCASFAVAKISKAKCRGAIFATEEKVKLSYRDSNKVKTLDDIVKNPSFHQLLLLPQNNVRIAKVFPIFHDWSFSTGIEYDDRIADAKSITQIIQHTAKYGGFGDFRPTFGRAIAEVSHE